MAEIVSGIESARYYISRGFFPIPAPYGEKGCKTTGWTKLRLTDTPELELYFGTGRQNIGVLLGEPNGLCDVDLDAPEARWAWAELGLETGFVFGHKSNPDSHYFFYADPPVDTIAYDDPAPGEKKKRLIELRSRGGFFQLVPPSRYPDREEYYEWAKGRAPGAPSQIDKYELETAVAHAAAACLLARHAKEGTRHHIFLALAGALARQSWHQERTENLVHAVYRVLWQNAAKLDLADREVRDTYSAFGEGRETTGLPTLRNLLDGKVLDALAKWLRIDASTPAPRLEPLWSGAPNGAAAAQPAPETPPRQDAPALHTPRKTLPEPHRLLSELRDMHIPQPRTLVEECLVRPSLVLTSSPERSGKTCWAVQMGMAIANGTGHLFENFKIPEKTNALIFEWDDVQGRAALKDFEMKCRAVTPDMKFGWITVPKPEPGEDKLTLADPELLEFMQDEIRSLDAGYVILDSYTALRGSRSARGGDVVKVEEMEVRQLSDMAVKLNCCMNLIHHDSKSSANLNPMSRAAGSYAVTAASEGVIRIARYDELPEDDPARLVTIRHRRLKGAEFTVLFREETLDFDLAITGAAAPVYPRLLELDHLLHGQQTFDCPTVAKELGWSRATAYRMLKRFCQSEVLVKSGLNYSWKNKLFKPKKEKEDP